MLNVNRYLLLFLALTLTGLAGSGCTKELRKKRHLALANTAFQAEKYDQAEIEYFKVLQVAPVNPDAIRQLGFIYQEEGKLLRAYVFLGKAAELDPDNPKIHLKLSLIASALGLVKKAADEASLVLAKQPGQPDALEVLTATALSLKAIEDTQQKIEKMRKGDQDRCGYHVAAGTFYLRRRDSTNAEIEFKKALALDPKSPWALAALAGLYFERNDVTAADQALKSAADLSPIRSFRRIAYAGFKARTGKIEEGKHIAEEITRQAPDYLPAWNFLAELASGEKKYDDSNSFLQRVLARDPENYEATMRSGNIALMKGDATNALATFTRLTSISLYSNSPPVQFQLARSHLLLGDNTKAAASLKLAIAANPNFADAILLLANINIQNGDVSPAITALTELIKRQPQIAQAHLLLVQAYLAQNDVDQALAVCRRMEPLFPKSPDVPFLTGSLLVREKKPAEARPFFEKTLELSPQYLNAVEQLVDLDLAERRYPAAIDRVQNQIDQNPKAATPLLLLARIHLAEAQDLIQAENQKTAAASGRKLQLADVPAAQPEVNQAEATLLKAVDLEPGLQTSYLMLAALYSASGKPQQALEKLNTILAKTNDMAVLMQVALLQDGQTNYPAARDAYEKLLVAAPNFCPALNNLAYLYEEYFDQLDKAVELGERARRLAPTDPSIADTLGWILYKRGDYPRALGMLEESATKKGSDPEIQFHLGMIHYMLGEEAPARVALQAAAQGSKNPQSKEQAARRLAMLAIDPKTADAAAVAELQKQLRDTPRDPIALTRLGAIQERDGVLDKAADTYQTALKYNPKNSAVTLKLAELYCSPGLNDPQKALDLAKAAHELSPDDPRASAFLGRLVYQTSGDSKWAGSLLEESARKLPGDPQVAYDLAWVYYSLGRVPEAQAQMQAAAKAGPTFPKTADANRFLTAVAASSDPAQAAQFAPEAQKILSAEPAYVPALMVSATAQEGQGKYDGAAQIYNQVLARYPLFTPATRNLGLLYFARLNDGQKAYDLTTKAREAFPQDPDVAKALGVLTYRKGNYARAAQLLKESALNRKNDAELLYYLGMAQYQLKAKVESKATLQQAISLNLQAKLAEDARRILTELK